MPYVERYFAPRHIDSSLEPCLKKSKLDYSALCKKKKTDVFIPLEAPSEKESSSGFSETVYYESVKGQPEKPRVDKDFLNGLDNEAKRVSSRNYNSEAHFSRKESKLDYSALCNKRNSEAFIPLETPSENCSPSVFSENSYNGSDNGENEKERDSECFLNEFDNEEESGPSKNCSSKSRYTRIESKTDNSPFSKKRNTGEYIQLDQSPSGSSETSYYGSDKGEHDKSRVSEDFRYGFYIDKKPGPYKNDCSEPPLTGREDSNKNQQILGLPKTDKCKNNNSEAAFSETSTAFIGPLYQPPPQVDTVSRSTNNENSKSPSLRTTTVVSGKAAGRTQSEGGMDYEMQQFYKELHQLEAATDDHNVIQTTANSPQHCSSHQSNALTIQEVRDHHNQKPSSQPCNPLPCKPSALIPPSYYPTKAPISPAQHPTLLPINNQDSCDRPGPIDRTNFSFLSQSLPPPCFQGPPPPPFDRTNSSFVSQSLPPPCFQGPPPPPFDNTNSSFVSQSLPPPCFQGPPPPAFDRTNSSFVSQSLPPPCFQGPPSPAFHRTNSSFVSQSLPPPCFPGPPPHAFHRTNSSFVSQSLPPPCFQGPPPHAFDRTNSSFVRKSLPQPCFQGPPPPAFDRTSSFVSKSLPPPRFQGSPPPVFDRTDSSFVSRSLSPPRFQGSHPPAFDRTDSSFVSQSLSPPRIQDSPPPAFDRTDSSFVSQSLSPPPFEGSPPRAFDRTKSSFVSQSLSPPPFQGSPPAFDRTNSSFVSRSLLPPRFQGSPPPAFDRTSSFVSQSLSSPRFQGSPPAFDRTSSSFVSRSLSPPRFQGSPPPAFDGTSSFVSQSLSSQRFQGSPPPAFDRTSSSFVSRSLSPPRFQGSPPAFDRTNSSFVSQSLSPPCFQGSPPRAFVGNHDPPPPRHKYSLIFPMEDDIQNSPYHENEKYDSVNDDHPRPTTQSPWHSSRVLPENRFSPQGGGLTESFTRPRFESSQQANQREDFYEQKGRRFNEILPQGGNFHEQYSPRFRDEAKCTDSKRKLVLLRGVPGSGKSTLARNLLDQSPDGIVFSTDDYFCQEKGYTYDVKLLGDAHNWNQNRAQRAMDDERSPIIIDNTNIQSWEMKPYVQMALESSYAVEFLEPNTWWKLDPHELEKRNTHRVPREKISQMLERFEHNMNVGVVMNSVEPRRVRHRRPAPEDRQRWGTSVDYTTHSSSFQIR